MSKKQELIDQLKAKGYEYKSHKGGMYSKYHASEFINEKGDKKYLYDHDGEKFWIEDKWRNVQDDLSIMKYGLMDGYINE